MTQYEGEQFAKEVADVAAASIGVATLIDVLPAIAAAVTILWLLVRIWEKFTGAEFHTSWIAQRVVWVLTLGRRKPSA